MLSANYPSRGDSDSGLRDLLFAIMGQGEWNNEELQRLLFGNIDDKYFEFDCHDWVTGLVRQMNSNNVVSDLEAIRARCMQALENSDLLMRCADDDREDLERHLEELIGQIGFYIEAVRTADLGRAEQFIDATIDKLRTSGYVYHPRKNLFMVLCLFIHYPRLMEDKMPALLSTLLSGKLNLWAREPFGALLTRILDNFVTYAHRNYDLTIVDRELQERLIIALNLELLLRDKCGISQRSYDARINHSLMLRLCSLMHVMRPERLLDMAVTSLISPSTATRHYSSLCLNDANHIANILDNQAVQETDNATGRYYTDKVEMSIDNDSIVIAPIDIDKEDILPFFETTLDRRKLQILINDIPPKELRNKTFDTIRSAGELWLFVENTLNDTQGRRHPRRSLPDVGECVSIIVCNQIAELTFECRIVDDRYEGMGTLAVKPDVVEYYPKDTQLNSFYLNGSPLLLEAKVVSIDNNGMCRFSLIGYIQDDMSEKIEYGQHLTCILNNRSRDAKRFPAISLEGFSMSIGVDSETDISTLHKGMVVEVEVDGERFKEGYVQATFLRERPDVYFSIKDAFRELMRWFADNKVYRDESHHTGSLLGQLDDDNIVSKTHAAELLNIIDARATTEDNYTRAYNYFRFCKVISHMLDMRERDEYYDNRLRLIELFDNFAVNSTVDRDEINTLSQSDTIRLSQTLTADADRLRLLSCLNSDDPADEKFLFDFAATTTNELHKKLATLTLSHNLVKKEGLIQQAEIILDEIRERLNLPQVKKSRHYYGKEDFHTEFKTSIIYPPNAMVIDIRKQTFNIMRVICGFLNADGGKLYMGVNDMGYETGIDEDLKHKQFNGLPQKYQSYVENSIFQQLGPEAAHNTKAEFDKEAEGTVLRVDIKRSVNPIKLDDNYYERMGTCTRQVDESYITTFINEHKRRNEALGISNIPEPDAGTEPGGTDGNTAKTTKTRDHIQTSRTRNNILHDYEPDYHEITAIICLLDNYEYMIIDEDDWQDYPLKLAIHEDETDDNLLLVYTDGYVSKIPLRDLLKKNRNNFYKRYNEKDLVYATIAADRDIIATILTNKSEQQRLRLDNVDHLDDDTLRGGGQQLTSVLQSLDYCEVVSPQAVEPYNLRRNMAPTDPCHSLTAVEVMPFVERLPGWK